MPEISNTNTMLDAKTLRQQALEARRKNMRESWHRFAKNKVALGGLIVIIILVILAVIAPYVAPYKYDKIDPIHSYQPPSKEHLFGTDGLGRDLFSRVLYGTRYSLAIAFASQLVGILGGIFFGSLAGFFGGLLSDILMRLCDILQAIPATLLAILISQTMGSGFFSTTIALAVSTIPSITRIVRSLIMQLRGQDYIEAGRAINCSDTRLITRHILPNIIPQVIVSFTGGLSGKFIESAGLSYLGLGVQPPTPEWGALLTDGKAYLRYNPNLVK